VGTKLFRADRRTDKTKRLVVFRNFAYPPSTVAELCRYWLSTLPFILRSAFRRSEHICYCCGKRGFVLTFQSPVLTICTACSNIHEVCILRTQCIYAFSVILTISSINNLTSFTDWSFKRARTVCCVGYELKFYIWFRGKIKGKFRPITCH
jgi:hypothetical protein